MSQTMKSQLLKLLKKQWLTPLDALEKVGCMSLSQRCGEFNRERESCQEWEKDFGGPSVLYLYPKIISKWMKLPNGKRVKSYRAV